jgi:hypothetical protein
VNEVIRNSNGQANGRLNVSFRRDKGRHVPQPIDHGMTGSWQHHEGIKLPAIRESSTKLPNRSLASPEIPQQNTKNITEMLVGGLVACVIMTFRQCN